MARARKAIHIYRNASDKPAVRLGQTIAPGQETQVTPLEHGRWKARPKGHKQFVHVSSSYSDGTPVHTNGNGNGKATTEDANEQAGIGL